MVRSRYLPRSEGSNTCFVLTPGRPRGIASGIASAPIASALRAPAFGAPAVPTAFPRARPGAAQAQHVRPSRFSRSTEFARAFGGDARQQHRSSPE